jgi:MYXO-CTERM domain-containing protein
MRPRLIATLTLVHLGLFAGACVSEGGEDADISACGDVEVEASAKCEVMIEGGCEAACEPVSFTAECQGQCNASVDATCKADCQATCQGGCDADPGNFDCEASCTGNCSGSCSGKCESDPDSSSCQGRCEATCEAECGASCEGTPPSATCDVQCESSCQGECKVEANIDCNLSCQAELQGGCEVQCQDPDGALFCDGQYVDHGGNLAECIAALNAYLEVEVDSSASAACEGNKCSASAEGSVTCSMPAAPSQSSPTWLLVLAGLAGLASTRRRRS